ncbi:MAG TPA: 50S ribosomal protein L17 [bacterium]|nr:50S ribosomal protein L17 [bacterium]HOH67382.1 50S ribosomal protein L17 [bacterium]HPN81115.1 50S ribosomal protein L17 [bacterium]HPW39133.1 50S ribosomal protein L17 [bacterium]
MRHQKKGKTLGRKKAPREAMLRNLATSFVIYEKVKTTKAKAKILKPLVEKLITLAKEDSLHHRRQALKELYIENAVKKLFEVLGPRFKNRNGGYTRLVKIAPRKNDGAEMAILELVDKE